MDIDKETKQKILLEYYEEHVKPTEKAHDRLLAENLELKKKAAKLEEESARYRDIASRLRQEKKVLLDRIEIMKEEREKEKKNRYIVYGHNKNQYNK